RTTIIALGIACATGALRSHAWDPPDKARKAQEPAMHKSAGLPRYAPLNINNVITWSRSDGQSNRTPNAADGATYPRGTANVIYQDGLIWGAKAFLDAGLIEPPAIQPIRVNGATYATGTRAGWIEGFGATARPVSPDHPEARIYRIRRDFAGMDLGELRRDAAEVYEILHRDVTATQMDAVLNQYATDWREWPVHRGAPYIERNGIPGYQPPPPFGPTFTTDSLIAGGYDEPGLAGAETDIPGDQALWTVYNDLDRKVSTFGSEPLGLEIQKTIWGYSRTDEPGHMYFTRHRIINKGGIDVGNGTGAFFLDSMFVGQFSDPDIGGYYNDLIGCDTLLQLGFAYNGGPVDPVFQAYGLPPPSVGYVLLAGPTIPSHGSMGTVDFRKHQGILNQPMYAFSRGIYSSLSAEIIGGYWKILRGFAPLGDVSTPDILEPSGDFPPSRFMYSGDPISRTGWIDGLGTPYSLLPGDRRLILSSGPFQLAPGDTQEVVMGIVFGLGADYISSIAVMKHHARHALRIGEGLFDLPRPPTPPAVYTAELDGEIVLEWGSDQGRVRDTEDRFIAGEYVFEGYNVYQLPASDSDLSQATRIATFDVENGVRRIVDQRFDHDNALFRTAIVQEGADSGIRRHLMITHDVLRNSGGPVRLRNGERYYFAVTAYSYSPREGAIPVSLESKPRIITTTPKVPFGIQPAGRPGDQLPVTRVSGSSEASVTALLIDPTQGTGHTYAVGFDTIGGI
ncbi:MAG: hypothetical protein WD295_05520, partial [Bacteroidota bacterium]